MDLGTSLSLVSDIGSQHSQIIKVVCMQVQIASKGIDVSPALQDRIKARLEEMMDKYIHRDGEAQVFISREGTGFKTNCSIHLPSGASMEAQGQNHDGYAAADEALEHMEKRLRRYSRRLKDHNAASKKEAFSMYILENPLPDNEDEDAAAGNADPIVIAEKSGSLKTMTPGMAALELGLADTGVVLFNNAKHGRLNVVFKRADGNIGWIDPKAD